MKIVRTATDSMHRKGADEFRRRTIETDPGEQLVLDKTICIWSVSM